MKHIIDWKSFLLPYELAVSGFIMKLGAIKKEYILKGENSPIEIVSGRVKSVPSILEKANRFNVKYSDIAEEIYDIAGIRIICKYIDDVYKVYELLKSRQDIEIYSVKDYIKILNLVDIGHYTFWQNIMQRQLMEPFLLMLNFR